MKSDQGRRAAQKGLTQDEKARAVDKIREYFRTERDEELGELAANLFLDFVAREIGPYFFNLGVREARALTLRTFADLEEAYDGIERLPPR